MTHTQEDTTTHPDSASSLSQVDISPYISTLLDRWGIGEIRTPSDLETLRANMYSIFELRPYDESTKDHEVAIRWKRTGSQVLEDGYVYQTKECTDMTVAFLALAKAAGAEETRFVKLKNLMTRVVHSVAEIKIQGRWYVFDVSKLNSLPYEGEITEDRPYIATELPSDKNTYHL